MQISAKLLLENAPVIEEMSWVGNALYENFSVRYEDIMTYQVYCVPQAIDFFWPHGRRAYIRFNVLKINPSISQETFQPDPIWFQGEVIDLADLDNVNHP